MPDRTNARPHEMLAVMDSRPWSRPACWPCRLAARAAGVAPSRDFLLLPRCFKAASGSHRGLAGVGSRPFSLTLGIQPALVATFG